LPRRVDLRFRVRYRWPRWFRIRRIRCSVDVVGAASLGDGVVASADANVGDVIELVIGVRHCDVSRLPPDRLRRWAFLFVAPLFLASTGVICARGPSFPHSSGADNMGRP